MILIEILYTTAAVVAISACIPQVLQLWRLKRSDELNLQSWTTWTFTQMVTLVYVISIGNVLMSVVNLVWVSFYVCMTVMIIRYRRQAGGRGPGPVSVHLVGSETA
ncbi:MAG: hypothetical protein ABIR91_01840 [Candidatus Saccharimonadales bacterium]